MSSISEQEREAIAAPRPRFFSRGRLEAIFAGLFAGVAVFNFGVGFQGSEHHPLNLIAGVICTTVCADAIYSAARSLLGRPE